MLQQSVNSESGREAFSQIEEKRGEQPDILSHSCAFDGLARPRSPWANPVVILSTASGGGHISAARAVEGAFSAKAEEACAHIEVLEHSSVLYRGIYNHGFLKLVEKAAWAYGAAYDLSDNPQLDVPLHLSLAHKLNTQNLRQSLKEHDPKVLFCTHFLPEQVALDLRKQGKISSKIAVVVTDQVIHAQWFGKVDAFFVGNDLVRQHLVDKGVPGEKVFVTGIPIDLKFARPYDKREAREKLQLRQDGEVVLYTGGGHGIGGVEESVKKLFPSLPPSAQLVVLCGKGKDLYDSLSSFREKLPAADRDRIVPVGFTKEMERYMAAADLMVGKPGGLTSAETLAMGLPFVMVNAMPGQEEGNADFISSAGAGVWVRDLRFLPKAICALLSSPERREIMSSAAKSISRPNAAEDIRAELARMASSC